MVLAGVSNFMKALRGSGAIRSVQRMRPDEVQLARCKL